MLEAVAKKAAQESFVNQMKGMQDYEAKLVTRKTRYFGQGLAGAQSVVEIGPGTGVNFPYYRENGIKEVMGIDVNPYFDDVVTSKAVEAGVGFSFRVGNAQALPLPDESVDAVVATLLLCSVESVQKTLSEVKRVLKPGGHFIFSEHIAAPRGTALRLAQDGFNGLQVAFAEGCRLNREPLSDISSVFGPGNVVYESWNVDSEDKDNIGLSRHFLLDQHLSGVAVRCD